MTEPVRGQDSKPVERPAPPVKERKQPEEEQVAEAKQEEQTSKRESLAVA